MPLQPGHTIGRRFEKGNQAAKGTRSLTKRLKETLIKMEQQHPVTFTTGQATEIRDLLFGMAKEGHELAIKIVADRAITKGFGLSFEHPDLKTIGDVKKSANKLVKMASKGEISTDSARELRGLYDHVASLIEKEAVDGLRAFKEDLESKIAS